MSEDVLVTYDADFADLLFGDECEKVERVTRCRDCRHMRHGCWYFKYWDEVNGEYVPSSVSSDGYCAWGEVMEP